VITALVFMAFVVLVALLSRRGARSRVQIRSCCSAGAWPPDDLTGAARRSPTADAEADV
jgi:hypothetical protein